MTSEESRGPTTKVRTNNIGLDEYLNKLAGTYTPHNQHIYWDSVNCTNHKKVMFLVRNGCMIHDRSDDIRM